MPLNIQELRQYLASFSKAFNYISSKVDVDSSVTEVAKKRVYTEQAMLDTLHNEGIGYADSSILDYDYLKTLDKGGLGLFSESGHFLLEDRYIIPIRDISGNVTALVGWLDDNKKYITSSSKFFSKATMLYGMEELLKPQGTVGAFEVEGIFDRLALKSIGMRAFATMGITDDPRKNALFSLTGRVVGIPDADSQGLKVLQEDKWSLSSNSSYFRWRGSLNLGEPVGYRKPKDVDELISYFTAQDMHEVFTKVYKTTTSRVITMDL